MSATDAEVFGPLVSPIDVREAVKATIEEWIETYLALVERHYGLAPRDIPLPADYVFSDDEELDKRPEDQMPTVVILCPGTKGEAKVDGEGLYRVPWLVNVATMVSARDPQATQDLAIYYGLALRAMLVHQGTLGGFALQSVWEGERNDPLRYGTQPLAAGVDVFRVLVEDVLQRGKGLKAPFEEPYEEVAGVPAKHFDVSTQPEEIQ